MDVQSKRGRDDAFRILLFCKKINIKMRSFADHKLVTILRTNGDVVATYQVRVRRNELYTKRLHLDERILNAAQADALIAYKLSQMRSTDGKPIHTDGGQCTADRCFQSLTRVFGDDFEIINTRVDEKPKLFSRRVIKVIQCGLQRKT